jgi:hypothetical protein
MLDGNADDITRNALAIARRRMFAAACREGAGHYRQRSHELKRSTLDEGDELTVRVTLHLALVYEVVGDEMERAARQLDDRGTT